jgi:hypothetical protein
MANSSGNVSNIVGLGGVDASSNLTIPEANSQGYFSLCVGVGTSGGNFSPFYKNGVLYQVPPYVFTVTSANATVGATYTNNGVTYTVGATIAAQTTLNLSAVSGAVQSGTTLTKTSGTGDATITFSAVTPGKTCVVVHVMFTSNTAGNKMQLASSLTTFAFNAGSITNGVYQGGASTQYTFALVTANVPATGATMYTFPSAYYPGHQVDATQSTTILICKEM